MGVQVVQNNPHHRGIWVGFIYQPAHLLGEIFSGSALGDGYMPPTHLGLAGQE